MTRGQGWYCFGFTRRFGGCGAMCQGQNKLNIPCPLFRPFRDSSDRGQRCALEGRFGEAVPPPGCGAVLILARWFELVRGGSGDAPMTRFNAIKHALHDLRTAGEKASPSARVALNLSVFDRSKLFVTIHGKTRYIKTLKRATASLERLSGSRLENGIRE
jgi:hypothetical protein